MSQKLKELEILSKYLSEEELKEIAKEVAKDEMRHYLGKDNQHRKTNLEYYIKKGAFDYVSENLSDFDIKEISSELKEKTISIVKELQWYNISDDIRNIAVETIKENKQIIEQNINTKISDFVNSENYESSYNVFAEKIGEMFADILHSALSEKYKKFID